jgi:hypothetical protein
MSTARPRLIVTRRLPEPVEAGLADEFDARINTGPPFDRVQLAEALRSCDALACTVSDRLDAELLAGEGITVRLLANFGVLLVSLAIGKWVGTIGYEPFFMWVWVSDMIAVLVLWTLVRAPRFT